MDENGINRLPASEPELSDDLIAVAALRLAEYIGPLARVFANKIARQAHSVEDLYYRLSEEIASTTERADFLKKTLG